MPTNKTRKILTKALFWLSSFLTLNKIIIFIIVVILLSLLHSSLFDVEVDANRIIAIATISYAILTWILISETSKATRLQIIPQLSVSVIVLPSCPYLIVQNHSKNFAKHLHCIVYMKEKDTGVLYSLKFWLFWLFGIGYISREDYFADKVVPNSKVECSLLNQFLKNTNGEIKKDSYGDERIQASKNNLNIIVEWSYFSLLGDFSGWGKEIFNVEITKDGHLYCESENGDFIDVKPQSHKNIF